MEEDAQDGDDECKGKDVEDGREDAEDDRAPEKLPVGPYIAPEHIEKLLHNLQR